MAGTGFSARLCALLFGKLEEDDAGFELLLEEIFSSVFTPALWGTLLDEAPGLTVVLAGLEDAWLGAGAPPGFGVGWGLEEAEEGWELEETEEGWELEEAEEGWELGVLSAGTELEAGGMFTFSKTAVIATSSSGIVNWFCFINTSLAFKLPSAS